MKKKWVLFTVILLALAGMVMTGCPTDPGGKDGDEDIDYTAVADTLEPSTKIIFTFDSDVTGLTASDITVTNGTGTTGGQASKTGTLTGSGKIWELGITVAKAGNVSVKITKSGIVSTAKTVTVKEAGTDPNAMAGYTKSKEIAFGAQYDFGDDDDPAWDITNLSDLDNIKAGSKLRLTFTATTSKASNGIGSIGYLTDDKTKVNNKYDLDVPANQTGTTFFIDIWTFYAKSTLALDYEDTLSIIAWKKINNVASGIALTKIELWEPVDDVANPPLPAAPGKPQSAAMANFDKVKEIAINCGVFNIALGKGNITGESFTAIKEASEDAKLRIYINNNSGSDRNTWGLGTIGGIEFKGKSGTSFYWDVDVKDIQANLIDTSTFISTNVWGGCAITLIELWEPVEGFEPYQYTILGGENGGAYIEFTTPVLKKDYIYTATLTVTRMEEGLVGNGNNLNGQCEGGNPYQAIGDWGAFNHDGSKTIVEVPDGGSVEYVYKFTAKANIGESTKQLIKLIVQTGSYQPLPADASYGIDCTLDVEEEEPPEETFEFPNFPEATMLEDSTSGEWGFGHRLDTFKSAKYIVIASVAGETGNPNGFGGMQFGIQGNGTDNWDLANNLIGTGDWTSIARAKDEIVYVVIDVTQFPNYATLMGDADNIQFKINYGANELGDEYKVYITEKTLTKPADAVDPTHATSTANGIIYFSTTVDLEAGSLFPTFTNATTLPALGADNNAKWALDKYNTDNQVFFDAFESAKYVVIASIGGGNNDGFGGIQPYVQGDGVNNWSQTAFNTGDWTGFAHTADDLVYFVFDLSTFAAHAQLAADDTNNQAQFGFNWGRGEFGNMQGYVTSATLTKPGVATDLIDLGASGTGGSNTIFGYITKTLPTGLIVAP